MCLVWETTHLHNGQLGNTRKLPLWISGRYKEVAERGGGGGGEDKFCLCFARFECFALTVTLPKL